MISAILLSAGQSKRMGAFKPLLPFGDITIVETCIHTLRDSGVDEIIVVIGHRAEEIQEKIKNLKVRFAFNPKADSEMSESISCGVREISQEAKATFIALVDQPAIPSKVINQIIQAKQLVKTPLVVPTYQGRGGHPVLVDLKLRNQLLNLDPAKGLRSLFEDYKDEVLRLEVDSPFILKDLDTWEDYRNLYLEVFGVEPPSQVNS